MDNVAPRDEYILLRFMNKIFGAHKDRWKYVGQSDVDGPASWLQLFSSAEASRTVGPLSFKSLGITLLIPGDCSTIDFRATLNWSPMMPRGTGFLDVRMSDRWRNSWWDARFKQHLSYCNFSDSSRRKISFKLNLWPSEQFWPYTLDL